MRGRKIANNLRGQVTVDRTLQWILWLIIIGASVFGFVKLVSRFST